MGDKQDELIRAVAELSGRVSERFDSIDLRGELRDRKLEDWLTENRRQMGVQANVNATFDARISHIELRREVEGSVDEVQKVAAKRWRDRLYWVFQYVLPSSAAVSAALWFSERNGQ